MAASTRTMHPLGFMAQFIPAGGHADPIIHPGQDGKGVSAQAESSGIKTLIMLKGDIFLAMMVRIRVMPGFMRSVDFFARMPGPL